jgi:hypothetical protein
MRRFDDRVVVVTGAASGIGRALAREFAAEGARLALADVDADGLRETAALAGADRCFTAVVDVADREAVERFAAAVASRFGAVHVVINNAGVTVSETIERLGYDDFAWLMGINFWGVVHGTKAFLPLLRQVGRGGDRQRVERFRPHRRPDPGRVQRQQIRGPRLHRSAAGRSSPARASPSTACIRRHPHEHPPERALLHRRARGRRSRARQRGVCASRTDHARTGRAHHRRRRAAREAAHPDRPDAWAIDRLQRWLPVRYTRVVGARPRLAARIGYPRASRRTPSNPSRLDSSSADLTTAGATSLSMRSTDKRDAGAAIAKTPTTLRA